VIFAKFVQTPVKAISDVMESIQS